jgi:hypothetical protein
LFFYFKYVGTNRDLSLLVCNYVSIILSYSPDNSENPFPFFFKKEKIATNSRK